MFGGFALDTQALSNFERFLPAVRDALGHATTHQAYYSVLAVLRTFRRRVVVRDGLHFANALPPVLRAIFVSDWDVDEALRPFGSSAEMTREAQEFRREHSFTPDDAIAVVPAVCETMWNDPLSNACLAPCPGKPELFWTGEQETHEGGKS